MSREREEAPATQETLTAMGQMMGELIHDISNEITVLQGWALLARGEVEAGRAPGTEVQRVLEISTGLGQMMRDMLETMADRTVSPELGFEPLPVTESALAQRVRELSGLTVRLHSELGEGARVDGRVSFWTRVVANLLSNAARHARGEIDVRLLAAELRGRPAVRLRVEDDGPGIDPASRAAIFRPFWRGENGEVGLGLSSVVWAVRQLEGEIEYRDGGPLGGAAFEVTVPLGDRPCERSSRPPRPRYELLRGMRISLIDDDHAVRRALTRLFQRAGVEVVEHLPGLESEDEVLVRIEASQPEMILLDLRLGAYGGLPIWNRMCLEMPELADRVIFMSGALPGDPDWERAQHTGRPFLTKPFDLDEVVELARAFRAGG
jgi:CheY-like chemotaxis protein